jgi:hypothetical protein
MARKRRSTDRKRQKQRAPGRATREAIDRMTWEGITRDEAAKAAGILPKSLYNSLRRPHVKRYYAEQVEALRTSGRARRIHRLEQLAEQNDNKAAAVNAIAALERLDEAAEASALGRPSAGFVIMVIDAAGERRELAPRDVGNVVGNKPPALEHAPHKRFLHE